MNELFPIASGMLLGLILVLIGPANAARDSDVGQCSRRCGRNVVSGAYRIGWEFLLIDIPLVGACSAAAFSTVCAVRRRLSTHARRPSEADLQYRTKPAGLGRG